MQFILSTDLYQYVLQHIHSSSVIFGSQKRVQSSNKQDATTDNKEYFKTKTSKKLLTGLKTNRAIDAYVFLLCLFKLYIHVLRNCIKNTSLINNI